MNRFSVPKLVKYIVGGVAGFLVLATAIIGFAHTKPGRPLLAMLGMAHIKGGAACPMGYDKTQTPEEREAARVAFAAAHPGSGEARVRPAFGFMLDKTTRDDVQAWAKKNNVECNHGGGFSDLACSNVASNALPPEERGGSVGSLWLTFGANDALIAVVAVRNEPSVEAAKNTFDSVTANVDKVAGQPTVTRGDSSTAYLSGGLLRQAAAEYSFHNYYAVARASNLGEKGYVVTEEYRSLPN